MSHDNALRCCRAPPEAAVLDRWKLKSAFVAELPLLSLAQLVEVRCSDCGTLCSPSVKRVALSFVVSWVSVSIIPRAKSILHHLAAFIEFVPNCTGHILMFRVLDLKTSS